MSSRGERSTFLIRAVNEAASISDLIHWAATTASHVSMTWTPAWLATAEADGLLRMLLAEGGGAQPAGHDPDASHSEPSDLLQAELTPKLIEALAEFDAGWMTLDALHNVRMRRVDGSVALGIRPGHRTLWTELDELELAAIPSPQVRGWVFDGLPEPTVAHSSPARASRGDTIVEAPREALPEQREPLWCKALGDGMFEVCCIPFFIFGLGLGDVVEASAESDGSWRMSKVVHHKRSAAWIEAQSADVLMAVRDRLITDRIAFEVESPLQLAVDVPLGSDWESDTFTWLELLVDEGQLSISYSG